MIEFLASSKAPDYGITDELKALLVWISGAQIERLLAPARKALELRGGQHDQGGGIVAPLPGAGPDPFRPEDGAAGGFRL
jgi:hypothetical protein